MVNVNGSCTLNLRGNRLHNLAQGLVRFNNTGTVQINSDGTNTISGSTTSHTIGAGTPTINVRGWDLPVDVGATGVAKPAMGYCYNIGSGRGTLTQNRLVTCNGTNWVQVDDPTKVY